MRIDSIKQLEKLNTIYTAYWIIDNLYIEELKKIKIYKNSIKFKVTVTVIYLDDLDWKMIYHKSLYRTIKKADIAYSNIPYFTERKEAIQEIINNIKKDTEYIKQKLQLYPKIVERLEELKEGGV